MATPYLETGESIVLTTDRLSVDGEAYDALLTSRRLILVSSTSQKIEPRVTPLARVETVRSGRAATGEPVIVLALADTPDGKAESQVLVFLQQPLENRRDDRDRWVRKIMELSVFCQEKAPAGEESAAERTPGMHPTVRRWVAPEIVRPRSEIVQPRTIVPELVITPEELPAAEPRPEKEEAYRPPEAGIHHEYLARATQAAVESITRTEESATPEPAAEEPPSMPLPASPDPLTAAILTATKAMIAEKAREELALPPRPITVRTTSSLPDVPAPQDATETIPSPRDEMPGAAVPPEPEEEIPVIVRSSTLPEAVPPESPAPAPQPEEPEPPAPVVPEKTVHDLPPAATPVVPVPPPPARPSPGTPSLLVPAAIIAILIIVLSVFVAMSGTLPATTVLPAPVPTVPVVTPAATTAPPVVQPAPQEGVWVRISSDETYSGKAGNPGFLQDIGGTGERLLRVHDSSDLVKVSVTKLGNSGSVLSVTIIRDGKTVLSRSTTAPGGSVEILIDPATGAPPGMGSPVPTAVETRPGQIDYL